MIKPGWDSLTTVGLDKGSNLNLSKDQVRELLSSLLSNKVACKYFATPQSKPKRLPIRNHPETEHKIDHSSEEEIQRWGRRIYYHLNAVKDGFNLRHMLEKSKSSINIVSKLQYLTSRYEDTFSRGGATIQELKSKIESTDDFPIYAHYYVSYIDPHLYSSLLYLNATKKYPSEYTRNIREFLFCQIKRVLLLYLRRKEHPSNPYQIDDESNLWWAYAEILRNENEDFEVGEFKNIAGAIEVCRNLMGEAGRIVIYPPPAKTFFEATPDIYGINRTRLFILLNCINVARSLPNDVDPEFIVELSEFATQQFNAIAPIKLKRMYLLGVSLQVSSIAIDYYNDDPREEVIEEDSGDFHKPPPSKGWFMGNGKYRFDFPDGRKIPQTLRGTKSILMNKLIVECQGSATQKELQKSSNISDCVSVLKKIMKMKYFGPHLFIPGGRDQGGYFTTIQKMEGNE